MVEDEQVLVDEDDEEQANHYPDAYVQAAKAEISNVFAQNPSAIYYLKQLEVQLEKRYFHWITARAAGLLMKDKLGWETVPLLGPTHLKFLFRKSYKDHKKVARAMADVVRRFSDPDISYACGESADTLFLHALMLRKFSCLGQDTNEFKGTKWLESNHDLDFILERDGKTYGCEVKNRWDYIKRDEMRVKVRICQTLGLIPLFIVRSAPKSYIEEVRKIGGFTLVFKSYIFPLGQKALANDVDLILGLPAVSSAAIPSGIIDRFENWHLRNL